MSDLVDQVKSMLDNIQQNLYDVAIQKRDACIQTVHTWEEFIEALSQKKMILAPWCDEEVLCLLLIAQNRHYFHTISSNCCVFALGSRKGCEDAHQGRNGRSQISVYSI